MVDFGLRLKQLRKERNLTQQQLADLIGVKNSVISFYEVGERTPSPDVMKKLALALHVSADYLLGLERTVTLDATGLDEQDCLVVQMMIGRLREKNK